MELPAFVKSVGLVGAMLFGKKGAAALAGISFIIGKIKELSELPKIIPIENMDLKTVEDFNKEITKLKDQLIEPVKLFEGEDGEDVFSTLTDAQVAFNKLLEDQIALLNEGKEAIRGQLPHHLELHKGLVSINEEREKSVDHTKKLSNVFKNIHEAHIQHKKQIEVENSLRMEILEKVQQQNEQFSLSQEIFDGINRGVSTFSKGIAEALVLGKKINMTFKQFAQQLLVDIIAKTIERLALLAIEELLLKKLFNKDNSRLATEKKITAEKAKQVALQAALLALGGGSGGGFKLFNKGGSVRKDQPVIVGDSASGRGGELFVPNSSGQIIPNSRLGSMGGAVNVNFNINTVDASGFEELLVRSRGTITQLINNAVNEKGRSSII